MGFSGHGGTFCCGLRGPCGGAGNAGLQKGGGVSRTLGFIIQDMSHGLNSLLSGTKEVSPFSLTTPMSSLKFLFSLMSVIIRLSHGHWSPV